MSKQKKNGILSSRFYRIYFAVVAAALVCIVIGLIWLNGVVRDYEIAQPVHAAEQVAKLFEDGDYARLYALDTSAAQISGGDEAFYVSSMTELARGKAVAWREAYSADSNERKYSVTLDGEKLATFTLVPSGETTGHGNTLWKLGDVTTHVALANDATAEAPAQAVEAAEPAPADAAPTVAAACRISAPSDYTVVVDGRTLTAADAVSTVPILPEGFLPEGVTAPTMTEYAFSAGSDAPQITATDPSGAAAEVVPDGDDAWVCRLPEDEAFKQQYSGAVVKLAERIAKYTVKDLSRSAITGNCASDSPAEDILKAFSNSWAPPHKSAKVTDAVVSDFHVLSDSCFTCHVEFTFTLRTRRGNDYVYPTAYTLCVIKHKGEGKLYNLQFN